MAGRAPAPRLRRGRLEWRLPLRLLVPEQEAAESDPVRDQAMIDFFASELDPPPPEAEQH